MNCAGSCAFGSKKHKRSVKKAKKASFGTKKSHKKSHKKGRKFGSRKMNHSKKSKRVQKRGRSHHFGLDGQPRPSISQQYVGMAPGQYLDHLSNIPNNLRSNFYTAGMPLEE